jgi:hypothetical protein
MNAGVIALVLGIGIAAWVFNKTSHRTNSNKTSIITAAFVGLIVMFVTFTLIKLTVAK